MDQDSHKNVTYFLPFFPAWHGLRDLLIPHKLDGKPLSTLAVKTGEVTGGRRDVDPHRRLLAVTGDYGRLRSK